MISRYSISVLGCLQIALSATLPAYSQTAAVGVNVVNPQRLNQADREAVLDQLRTAGVRIIRAPLEPPWAGGNYGPAIDFIRRAYERGISRMRKKSIDRRFAAIHRLGHVRKPLI